MEKLILKLLNKIESHVMTFFKIINIFNYLINLISLNRSEIKRIY